VQKCLKTKSGVFEDKLITISIDISREGLGGLSPP